MPMATCGTYTSSTRMSLASNCSSFPRACSANAFLGRAAGRWWYVRWWWCFSCSTHLCFSVSHCHRSCRVQRPANALAHMRRALADCVNQSLGGVRACASVALQLGAVAEPSITLARDSRASGRRTKMTQEVSSRTGWLGDQMGQLVHAHVSCVTGVPGSPFALIALLKVRVPTMCS